MTGPRLTFTTRDSMPKSFSVFTRSSEFFMISLFQLSASDDDDGCRNAAGMMYSRLMAIVSKTRAPPSSSPKSKVCWSSPAPFFAREF